MIQVRKANQRGHTKLDWLDSYHTFSFGEYYDANQMGFRALRVINDDRVAPGSGFDMHRHRDMEIVTYVLSGELEHKDSLGTGSIIKAGELQRMTAGTGISHSERNPSPDTECHLMQIWVHPDERDRKPTYEQKSFAKARADGMILIGSRDGRHGSITIHQDMELYKVNMRPGLVVTHGFASGRHAWIQVIRGKTTVNNVELATGDGAAVTNEWRIRMSTNEVGELLLFEMN